MNDNINTMLTTIGMGGRGKLCRWGNTFSLSPFISNGVARIWCDII